ncbi:hypothetical protein L2E82_01734 [Cichorium intybus]|uniref:Uncharacterized protein n=1 Tax=Cichorium intybus TaxID=13427 RepID=A0ACB9H0Z9_CICIN|nr:hypothetical protein L2E82_01734 [Cichorium intybus]
MIVVVRLFQGTFSDERKFSSLSKGQNRSYLDHICQIAVGNEVLGCVDQELWEVLLPAMKKPTVKLCNRTGVTPTIGSNINGEEYGDDGFSDGGGGCVQGVASTDLVDNDGFSGGS